MSADQNLVAYYAKRAAEYERIYQKPERQRDLNTLRELLRRTLQSHAILEVACGTGYWTELVAPVANSILATDINAEVLALAQAKSYGGGNVAFEQREAFHLGAFPGRCFTAALAAFWWSHLRLNELRQFLVGFHRALSPGALVVFFDNRFVAGSSTPICRTDDEGNTYQLRRLDNGESHEVLKNFPKRHEAEAALSEIATDIHWTELDYYWFLTYRISL